MSDETTRIGVLARGCVRPVLAALAAEVCSFENVLGRAPALDVLVVKIP